MQQTMQPLGTGRFRFHFMAVQRSVEVMITFSFSPIIFSSLIVKYSTVTRMPQITYRCWRLSPWVVLVAVRQWLMLVVLVQYPCVVLVSVSQWLELSAPVHVLSQCVDLDH